MPAAEMQSFRATTPDLLRGERGWMSQIKTAAPGGGRKMFLTSPFIDQAIALRTRSMSAMAIYRQSLAHVVRGVWIIVRVRLRRLSIHFPQQVYRAHNCCKDSYHKTRANRAQ